MKFLAPAVLFVGLTVLVACGEDDGVPTLSTETTTVGDYAIQTVADRFDRPTQVAFTGEGDVVIAELAGEENEGVGRILRLDLDDPDEREVLQTGLRKPTGVAVVGETLWVMEERSLSFASLEPDAQLTPFLEDMPYNGRSQGSLTVAPDDSLIYDTSGSKRGADVVDGSATIFRIDDADPIGTDSRPSEPVAVATGFKHGYAHTFDSDGQMWATEMTDGTFDDEQAEDELVLITEGADYGWPFCVGNNRPVTEFEGTEARCAEVPGSHALFAPRATPTAVEVAPWDSETLLVGLWVTEEIVSVPRGTTQGAPWTPVLLFDDVGAPQDFLVDGDRLLVLDHTGGRILAVAEMS